MAVIGIESLVYGVDDMAAATRFFEDFGLVREGANGTFRLAEGSSLVLRPSDDLGLPAPAAPGTGPGPRELVWGVDSERALGKIADDLARDRKVTRGNDGAIHTRDDADFAIGFRVYDRKTPHDPAQSENGLARMARWNQLRKWYEHARPQVLHHAVFGVPDVDKAVSFYVKRLDFRITDMIKNVGVFMRCDGRPDHHNLFFHRGKAPFFNHAAFGVENIDELMTGVNEMQRKGWKSEEGLGRHRMTSIIFAYFECPAGGSCEYMCDSDYLTDAWQPHLWDSGFANHHWLSHWDRARPAPQWRYKPLPQPLPSFAEACALPL
jgi:catechol 2,3-dioxygenase-like lactoylglutathione lyase family enzyme